ncbi:L-histidine N(alpha)-methyltransferase [Mesorhizobium sp.]|uniref:L-histidine N(alpha)-methyltransferase n=1 Tax=Mesorhizobium sp. TaxID=1871066 RepID=UPI000FE72F10|nr:L-histidine N(alpha)-methyltransferase [Mesorhizobium sp.]RWI04238.1 MAG: L-histidine N(alpha)-methyltransferase [Mesorhizobium sp.]RWL18043.1 MAG: L-histidine N(alpha)-methyltransferase [Mesorhizobium sp.]TIP41323.1 MAG: L-histidine N(alpha)-methyltransferase [Mesorhizobium sp.]TIP70737.1 MAG: L-histidine N(alpha)-methyltransferase [Mesorhizobium sp.]TIQ19712.1 MAG: L-histidine N(alpha)-methyltransferase [Mesorhizobium sp.]
MARHNPSEGPPSRKYNIIGADIPETVLFKGDSLVSSLSGTPRVINCVYYYDDTGSILFERLCSEPTYYLFRTEKEIISQNAKAIAGITGPVSLIELGSGNAGKTTLLVDAYVKTHGPASYTAIDINHSILERAAENILSVTPDFDFLGIVGTYQTGLVQTKELTGRKLLVSFGSAIGNLYDNELCSLLLSARAALSPGDYFLVGIDLDKETEMLEAAYNNQTAILGNLCVLQHLNWRFSGNFDIFQFRHVAFHNKSLQRVEAHLEAMQAQSINLQKLNFSFQLEKGEMIRTEIMRKVDLNSFHGMFIEYGFRPVQNWTDSYKRYAVCLFQLSDKQFESEPPLAR